MDDKTISLNAKQILAKTFTPHGNGYDPVEVDAFLDQIIHDVCMQNLHVVFALDRSGFVGADGRTHNGCFDLSYLSSVPGMTLYCPSSFAELQAMLNTALYHTSGPVALRYPRGGEGAYKDIHNEPVTVLRSGTDLTIVTYGILVNEALQAADELADKGVSCEVLKLGRVLPAPIESVLHSLSKTRYLIAVEDVCSDDCVGMKLLAACEQEGILLKGSVLLNLKSGIVPHGAVDKLMREYHLDAAGIAESALALCGGKGGAE